MVTILSACKTRCLVRWLHYCLVKQDLQMGKHYQLVKQDV
jgi:hypothetical protein